MMSEGKAIWTVRVAIWWLLGWAWAGVAARAGEPHPVLIFSASDVPALTAKLGSDTVFGRVGQALPLTLAGQRDAAAIAFVQTALAGTDGEAKYDALLIYDLQHPHMAASEQSTLRAAFLADAQALYDQAHGPSPPWWFAQRFVSNWTYRHAGFPLQRILFPALMFPDDPRSPQLRDYGLQLLQWVMEAGPNDGEWNQGADVWATTPGAGEMIDETLGTPGSYGIWGAINLNELMHVVDRLTDFDPYGRLSEMMRSEARYWTYLLSYDQGLLFNPFGVSSLASYTGQTGHGNYAFLGVYSNAFMLHWARVYDEPVFAWHYYANPSPLFNSRTTDYVSAGDWADGPGTYTSWLTFLDWGEVAPQHPASAGWPLAAYWPNAGVGVIRKSWAKRGPGSGVIWVRAGAGGGHDRPTQAGLQYHADDTVVLGSGPWDSYTTNFLTFDARNNNTLLVDGAGQVGNYAGSGELERLRHGSAQRLGPETFVLSTDALPRLDFQSYYRALPFGVSWRRKVHYDRARDLLWVKDVASTGDGLAHQLRFNWVSAANVVADDEYALPAGYVMVADANQTLTATLRTHVPADPGDTFTAIEAGADATELRVLWAVSRTPAAARAYLAAHRGVFVSGVGHQAEGPAGFRVRWQTDEPSLGRIEYGATTALGQTLGETGTPRATHELLVPEPDGFYYRIIAADSFGDETTEDNGGALYRAIPDGNEPGFYTVTPCRLLDTRQTGQGPALASGVSRVFTVPPGCGIPAAAKALTLNLTVVGATGVGHLTGYPADVTIPATSTLNFLVGLARANNAILPLATDGSGQLAFRAMVGGAGTAHLVVDVTGYFRD